MDLAAAISDALTRKAIKLGIELTSNNFEENFKELILKAALRGRVVILIDEFDRPIIEFLEDPAQMDANRAIFRSFYNVINGCEEHIRFLLITGVSAMMQGAMFSDLNNLCDISLSPGYGALVGFTQDEFEENFGPEIQEMQKCRPDILGKIKDWYYGYTWDRETWVYNSFGLLLFLKNPIFHHYWCMTGTATMLYKKFKKYGLYKVEGAWLAPWALRQFDMENPDPFPLLFQTGCLTIKDISPDGKAYELSFPNREVKSCFLDGLLCTYTNPSCGDAVALIVDIATAIKDRACAELIRLLNCLMARIPSDDWHARTMFIFTVVLFLTFQYVGLDVSTVLHNSNGGFHIIVQTDRYIYMMALKLDGTADEALQEIKQKSHMAPFLMDSRQKLTMGISFSSKDREVADYLVKEED